MNTRLLKLIFLFGGSLYCVLAVFSPLLLKLWLRDKFIESLPGAFRIMLAATFLTLLGVPAYYTIIGLGKLRVFITATVISTIGNFVLVTSYYHLTGNISVYSIGVCLIICFAASTIYLLYKAYCWKEQNEKTKRF